MERFQKRQYLLLALMMAVVLAGAFMVWQQQSQSVPATATVQPAVDDIEPAEPEIVVYVSGFVVRPGVYRLSGIPRAIDCVNAAGGFATGANAAAINLAQKVADGMQIHVPGSLSPADPRTVAPAGQAAGKVSLNQADKNQLDSLPGIGPALAERIIEYRTNQGGFKTIEELKKVSGIGEAKYNSLKDKVSL